MTDHHSIAKIWREKTYDIKTNLAIYLCNIAIHPLHVK